MVRMDMKEAVEIAKEYFANLYDDEHIRNVGLEEAKFGRESNTWKITIGFFRGQDDGSEPSEFDYKYGEILLRRSYKTVKTVHINDANGNVELLNDRFMVDAFPVPAM